MGTSNVLRSMMTFALFRWYMVCEADSLFSIVMYKGGVVSRQYGRMRKIEGEPHRIVPTEQSELLVVVLVSGMQCTSVTIQCQVVTIGSIHRVFIDWWYNL